LQIVFIEGGYIKSNVDTSEMNCYGPTIVSIPPTVVHGLKSQPGTKGYVLTSAERSLQQISNKIEHDNFDQLRHTPKVLSLDPYKQITADVASTIRTIDHEFRWPQSGRVQLISAYLNILMI
jgi:AraC family transcriptional activator of pobA